MKYSHVVPKFIIILLVYDNFDVSIANDSNQSLNQRQSKVLTFFGVGLVRFENSECFGSGSLQGTCYTRQQCRSIDGIGSTRCANGIGVCCVIQRTCGETSSLNNTYFVSPGFPSAYTGSSVCTITIQKCEGACQIRLDFLTLRLAQPNANGTCATDALVVTGGASTVPIICGENTGQHIYVDFNDGTPITISISTSGTTSAAVAWNIKITQIGCNCPTRAPSGCLQYFNSTTGTVRSFNYGNSINQNGTRQLANLNYGVCIAMIPGYCGIRWSQSPGTYSFSVSNNTFDNVGDGTIATPNAELFGTNCTTDFVVIPAPNFVNGTASNTDRFCGNGFAPVISNSKPFVLSVVTNSNEINDTGNAGFSLDFSQQRCAGSILMG